MFDSDWEAATESIRKELERKVKRYTDNQLELNRELIEDGRGDLKLAPEAPSKEWQTGGWHGPSVSDGMALGKELQRQVNAAQYTGPSLNARAFQKVLDAKVGIGGAPTRATTLPEEPSERKKYPVATGVLDYFPDAIVALSKLSWQGNEQHNPGQPLHWARGKSADEADTLIRHFMQRGTVDKDGIRHTTKLAWRALALLQKELEDPNGA